MEEGDSGRIPMIKIKIPKKTGEEEGVPSHYCKECDRSFSSGKALGGHMSSAHVQANKDYSMRKAMSFNSKSKSSPGSPACSCIICGRAFQSQKSLFGHMRCHPERDWRGMEPPKSESSEELGFFNVKPWPTCKRGRPSVAAAMEEEKEKGEGDGMDEMFKVAVQVLASGKMEKEYGCDKCGRVFKSHEALGGHRASHNKFKMTVINTCTRHLDPKKTPKTKKKKPDFVTADHVDGGSASASAITPASASGSRFALDIDLNVSLAEEEEDEGEEESSNDTSSSR